MSDSTLSALPRKAVKKKPERAGKCPLFAHASGQWVKEIDGKLRYFEVLEDFNPALDACIVFVNGWDDQDSDPNTLRQMCNDFLAAKTTKVDIVKMKQLTWEEQRAAFSRANASACLLGAPRLLSPSISDGFAINYIVTMSRIQMRNKWLKTQDGIPAKLSVLVQLVFKLVERLEFLESSDPFLHHPWIATTVFGHPVRFQNGSARIFRDFWWLSVADYCFFRGRTKFKILFISKSPDSAINPSAIDPFGPSNVDRSSDHVNVATAFV